jgi:hypothetical protein
MEISITYQMTEFEPEAGTPIMKHGVCLNASFVNTNEEEKYFEFCEKISHVMYKGVTSHPQTFAAVVYKDLTLWIGDRDYKFPKKEICPTPDAVKKHIDCCMDMHEAFYVN